MYLYKITRLILVGLMSLVPMYAVSATKSVNSDTAKTIQGSNKKKPIIAQRKVAKVTQNSQQITKVKSATSTKKTAKTVKKATAKTSKSAKNETKQLYGVKGAKLAHTKVSNKVYSYREKGKTYTSIHKDDSRLFSQTGTASYYGGMFHGRKTASGEIFNKNAYTAAHKTLALGSYALVTNLRNGRKVIVKINDRGPFSKNRIIDLSVAAAKEIGMLHSGLARVKIEAMYVDKQGYISGKAAHSLYRLAKREGLPLKVKGEGNSFSIKAK